MTELRFLDTNVLLYAACAHPGEEQKIRKAREILDEPGIALSVQVLQEFYSQATRPSRIGRLSHDDAMRFLEPLMELPLQDTDLSLFRDAVAVGERFGLSFWDAAILAAARALGCDFVYSEDLSSQQDYGGIRVLDPFAHLTKGRVPTRPSEALNA